MDANARLDYFRSELLGQVEKVRKEATEMEKRLSAEIKMLEETVIKLSRRVHEALR